jgi:quercetin dioxygenase-like cupin family protein
MSDYTKVARADAYDFMAQYPGYGEMRIYTPSLDSEQVAFTWREMPAGTGGRGSYGHRHKTQEEIYFVIDGTVTFKVGDEVFEAGPGDAVRMAPQAVRSIHNDTDDLARVILVSKKIDDPEGDVETVEGFWPE